MARYSFFTAQAYVVVDPAGHFDVYPTADRPGNDKPVYRGELSKLGAPIRDGDGRLAVRCITESVPMRTKKMRCLVGPLVLPSR